MITVYRKMKSLAMTGMVAFVIVGAAALMSPAMAAPVVSAPVSVSPLSIPPGFCTDDMCCFFINGAWYCGPVNPSIKQ